MREIRSIQVVNVRWFNATAWYALYLSRLLRRAGHPTLVLALPDTAAFRKAEEWGLEPVGLPLNDLNPLALPGLYGELARLVNEFKPQVVNCHRGESFILWGLLKKHGAYALARTRGDQRPPRNSFANRLLHNQTADAIIATNSATARSFTENLKTDPDKIFTILGGVDTSRFFHDKAAGTALRERLGITRDEFVLGILGRLDPVKGHGVLIRALGEAKKSRPGKKLRLLCIGAESNLKNAELELMAAGAGVSAELIITGLVDEVRDYINALDLGVLASTGSEAIARAALEIMACRVPLLSTDVGVMPDLLPRDVLVPLDDAGAMARGLVKCLDDPAWLERLRECGDTAMNGLSPDDFLHNTLAAYEYALRNNN